MGMFAAFIEYQKDTKFLFQLSCIEINGGATRVIVAMEVPILFIDCDKTCKGKIENGQIDQIKTCREKWYVIVDDMKKMLNLICGRTTGCRNYNSTYYRKIKLKNDNKVEQVRENATFVLG